MAQLAPPKQDPKRKSLDPTKPDVDMALLSERDWNFKFSDGSYGQIPDKFQIFSRKLYYEMNTTKGKKKENGFYIVDIPAPHRLQAYMLIKNIYSKLWIIATENKCAPQVLLKGTVKFNHLHLDEEGKKIVNPTAPVQRERPRRLVPQASTDSVKSDKSETKETSCGGGDEHSQAEKPTLKPKKPLTRTDDVYTLQANKEAAEKAAAAMKVTSEKAITAMKETSEKAVAVMKETSEKVSEMVKETSKKVSEVVKEETEKVSEVVKETSEEDTAAEKEATGKAAQKRAAGKAAQKGAAGKAAQKAATGKAAQKGAAGTSAQKPGETSHPVQELLARTRDADKEAKEAAAEWKLVQQATAELATALQEQSDNAKQTQPQGLTEAMKNEIRNRTMSIYYNAKLSMLPGWAHEYFKEFSRDFIFESMNLAEYLGCGLYMEYAAFFVADQIRDMSIPDLRIYLNRPNGGENPLTKSEFEILAKTEDWKGIIDSAQLPDAAPTQKKEDPPKEEAKEKKEGEEEEDKPEDQGGDNQPSKGKRKKKKKGKNQGAAAADLVAGVEQLKTSDSGKGKQEDPKEEEPKAEKEAAKPTGTSSAGGGKGADSGTGRSKKKKK